MVLQSTELGLAAPSRDIALIKGHQEPATSKAGQWGYISPRLASVH